MVGQFHALPTATQRSGWMIEPAKCGESMAQTRILARRAYDPGRRAAATSLVAVGLRGVRAGGAADVGQALPAVQPHGASPKPGSKGFLSDLHTVRFGGVISFTR